MDYPKHNYRMEGDGLENVCKWMVAFLIRSSRKKVFLARL